MGIAAIDHLYVETRSFEKAKAFWEGLGFTQMAQWGEDGHVAGIFQSGKASIVVAEVGKSVKDPAFTVHFQLEDADAFDEAMAKNPKVEVATKLEATHWGTRWMRVKDADGRVHALEEPRDAVKKAAKKTPAKKKAAPKKKARAKAR